MAQFIAHLTLGLECYLSDSQLRPLPTPAPPKTSKWHKMSHLGTSQAVLPLAGRLFDELRLRSSLSASSNEANFAWGGLTAGEGLGSVLIEIHGGDDKGMLRGLPHGALPYDTWLSHVQELVKQYGAPYVDFFLRSLLLTPLLRRP